MMDQDERQIRGLIADWLRASEAEDLETVFSLISDDAVFLTPGRPPMHKRDFIETSRKMKGKTRLHVQSEVREVRISGDMAYSCTHLSLTVTPVEGGAPAHRSGDTLSVLRKGPDGRWLLARDANLLAPES
jgi:uncharacterized protein (TIGR02246 family)